MSTTSIMSVKEMIEKSFGGDDSNWVNFRLVQATLFLLARQLRILERHVTVDLPKETLTAASSNITVTEIDLNKKDHKKPRKDSKTKKPEATKSTINAQLGQKESIHAMHTRPRGEKTQKDESKHLISEASEMISSRKSFSETMTDLLSIPKSPAHTTSSNIELPPDEKKKYYNLLEKLEEQREFVLRVIHQDEFQRHDSREERLTSPTPMASLQKTEVEIEKLLIVETGLKEDEISSRRGPRNLAIVTPQEFKELQDTVKELQNKFESASPDFPENIKLMQDLRKGGVSLTDAMAALQLSARLEAAEKAIENMTHMLTAVTTGDMEARGSPKYSSKNSSPRKVEKNFPMADNYEMRNVVTQDQLRTCISELTTEIYTRVNNDIGEIAEGARMAKEVLKKLEKTIKDSEGINKKVEDLETLVQSYISRLNKIDAGFASHMSIYQEQLNQMQMNLDAGLEEVSEALANKGGGETEISAELNAFIKSLQDQIDKGNLEQKELFLLQDETSLNLQHVIKEIELLRDTKVDRDEVEDALRDKAGLENLNGLVTHGEFISNMDETKKNINNVHKRLHEVEDIWTEIINQLEDNINHKVDTPVLESLRESIKENLEMLKDRISFLSEVVGEPKAAAVSRKLHRDATCLSCAAPAYMDTQECNVPKLPAAKPQLLRAEVPVKEKGSDGDQIYDSAAEYPDISDEKPAPNEDGDHRRICCRKFQISHPKELRAKTCTRYCGGSHTKLNNLIRLREAITVNSLKRETKLLTGTDGKVYRIDEVIEEKPCIPCNNPPDTPPQAVMTKKTDDFEDIQFNGDGSFSLQPSIPRPSVAGSSYTQRNSIHEEFRSCECFREATVVENASIKGVKSEELVNSHHTELSTSYKSLPVSRNSSLNGKPKKNSILSNAEIPINLVPPILKDHREVDKDDAAMVETIDDGGIIITTKKRVSKSITIQDDKCSESIGSVSYDVAELLETGSRNSLQ